MLLIIAMLAGAAAPIETTSQYKDWIAVCDNTQVCKTTLVMGKPESMEVQFSVARDATAAALPKTSIYWPSDNPTSQALVIDGTSYPLKAGRGNSAPVHPADELRIARAIANAQSIEVVGDAKHVPISAAGAAAAFRFVDARQRRDGTVTAVVAVGPKSTTSVPAALQRPVIAEMRAEGGPVMKPTPALLAKWRNTEDCPAGADGPGYTSWPVDRHTAAIIIDCDAGGFQNANARVKVGSRTDGSDAHPAEFDYDASMSEAPTTTSEPLNPELNTKTGRMESGERGGLVGAGSYQQWVWDGQRFRAVERGSAYGREFTAQVIRQ